MPFIAVMSDAFEIKCGEASSNLMTLLVDHCRFYCPTAVVLLCSPNIAVFLGIIVVPNVFRYYYVSRYADTMPVIVLECFVTVMHTVVPHLSFLILYMILHYTIIGNCECESHNAVT